MGAMIAVIIAGGSGTRLWPLSTPTYPKHLLKVNGDEKSLLQNTYERAKQLTDKIYVISEIGHIQHVKHQLPELRDENFIVEPARRGTASCILAALVTIAGEHNPKEPIAFMAADHYIRDTEGFVHSFTVASGTAQKYGRIVLVGIEPDYPATGFGYIQKGTLLANSWYVYNVSSFKEKPNYETAKAYLKSGNYLWNAGYFVGSLATFQKALRANAPKLADDYLELKLATGPNYDKVYLGLENISIDYALIEKVKDLMVVPASFDWMDLGSFADMHKAVEKDEHENHIAGTVEIDGVENAYIENQEDKPVAVIGLDNVVVVNTPNGILVARKDLSQRVGDISKRFSPRQ